MTRTIIDRINGKALLLILVVASGCQTSGGKTIGYFQENMVVPTSSSLLPWKTPAPPTPMHQGTLNPKSEVEWHITSGQKPIPIMSGRNVIGPDGTMVIGPYGQFPVGGMNVAQAGEYIEQKLRNYVVNPKVQLQKVNVVQEASTWSSSQKPVSKGWGESETATGTITATELKGSYIAPNWEVVAPQTQSPANKTFASRFSQLGAWLIGQ